MAVDFLLLLNTKGGICCTVTSRPLASSSSSYRDDLHLFCGHAHLRPHAHARRSHFLQRPGTRAGTGKLQRNAGRAVEHQVGEDGELLQPLHQVRDRRMARDDVLAAQLHPAVPPLRLRSAGLPETPRLSGGGRSAEPKSRKPFGGARDPAAKRSDVTVLARLLGESAPLDERRSELPKDSPAFLVPSQPNYQL